MTSGSGYGKAQCRSAGGQTYFLFRLIDGKLRSERRQNFNFQICVYCNCTFYNVYCNTLSDSKIEGVVYDVLLYRLCGTMKLAVQGGLRQMRERADDPDERHVTRPLQMKGSSSRNRNGT